MIMDINFRIFAVLLMASFLLFYSRSVYAENVKKEYNNSKNFSNFSKRKDGYRRSFPVHPEKIGKGKHPPALELADLPKDRFGLIDWATAVREGKIAPLSQLGSKNTDTDKEEYYDKQMILLTGITFNDVIFPHDIHTYWLNCETCHDQIFIKKRGANNITMFKNKSGKYCGRCHGKVAFPFETCERCHVLPKVNFPY